MDKINKLTLPTTILIASIILGGFYYATQISKQNSIERQQQVKIAQEQLEKENLEKILNDCLSSADWKYLSVFERISRISNPGQWENMPVSITSYNIMGDTSVEKQQNLKLWKNERDECFKK
ncbi:MAG: hypothetical protein AAB407_01620 [Patescibacteria group bacterium]